MAHKCRAAGSTMGSMHRVLKVAGAALRSSSHCAALVLSTVENEARVRDVDLAAELGMARPTNIRKFIETHRDELESFGGLHAVNANPGLLGGRPTTEFHLNRNQALLTCILSGTPKGRQIRAEVIHDPSTT